MTEQVKQKKQKTLYERYGGQEAMDKVITQFFKYALNDQQLCGYFIANVDSIEKVHNTFRNHIIGLTGGGQKFFADRNLEQIHQKMIIKQRQFGLVWHYLQLAMKDVGMDQNYINQIKQIMYGLSHRVMNTEKRSKESQQRQKKLKQKKERLKKWQQKRQNQDQSAN